MYEAVDEDARPLAIPDARGRIDLGARALQAGALEAVRHAQQEIGRDDRLGEVVVGASGERTLDALRILARGEKDDGNARPARVVAHHAAQLDAVDARHVEVEQDQIRVRHLESWPEAQRILERHERQALWLQQRTQRGEDVWVVIDGEYGATAASRVGPDTVDGVDQEARRRRSLDTPARAAPRDLDSMLHAVGVRGDDCRNRR